MNDATSTTSTLPDDLGHAFVTTLREVLLSAADALGDLDRRAGDGDFGANVRTAMKNAEKEFDTAGEDSHRDWATAMSRAWLGVGGTSGPLFGMFFRDLARAVDGDAVPTLGELTEALAAGQAVIQKYGEAKVGDRTMVDALAPAVDALRQQSDEGAGEGEGGADPSAALAAAEQAAVDAATATADLTARRGRASYVGDSAKGVIDPGAAAMALVIGALRAAVSGGGEVDTAWIQ